MQNCVQDFKQFIFNAGRQGISLWAENGQLKYKAPKGALTEEMMGYLKENKEGILSFLMQSKDNTREFPLTDIQFAYLIGRENNIEYGGVPCHVYLEIDYDALDVNQVERIWNRLIQGHDMLRAIILKEGQQKILTDVKPYKVEEHDVAKSPEKLEQIRKELGEAMYETERWPLFDVQVSKNEKKSTLHLSFDFLIADWVSIWQLLHEFEDMMEAPGRGPYVSDFSFRDYIEMESGLKHTEAYAKAKAYWIRRVEDIPPAPKLPLADKGEVKNAFYRHSLELDRDQWLKLKDLSQKNNVTPTSVFLALYALSLERFSENKHFCINMTMLNRPPVHEDIDRVIGDFTSTSILEVDRSKSESFMDFAYQIQARLFKDLDNRLFSGVEVGREITKSRGQDHARMPFVFTSSLGLSNMDTIKGKIGSYGISQTPQVFIDCQVMDVKHGLRVNWDERLGVFPEGMIADAFEYFSRLLESAITQTAFWNTFMEMPLPARQLRKRQEANQTRQDLNVGTLHEPILDQAKAHPEKVAVVDFKGAHTYEKLQGVSAAIAHALKEQGVTKGSRVAILMEKSMYQPAAVLAILSLGAIYVPVDAGQPVERISKIIEVSKSSIILADFKNAGVYSAYAGAHVIDCEALAPMKWETSIVKRNLEDVAYIIFTSGSTGVPKGVVISHKAASNTILDINRRFGISAEDCVLGISKLNFDLSVYDIFGLLSVGGKIVYPSPDRQSDPSHWHELIQKHSVTTWNTVPAINQMYVTYAETEGVSDNSMRNVMLSGDWIPVELPAKIKETMNDARVICMGGATEASIWSNYHIYENEDQDRVSIPYGYPLSNQGFMVLDGDMNDCPQWVPGELFITGSGLANGYFNDENATASHFVRHPKTKEIVYRTGDYGRYLPSGEIEFLGRKDNQVKIRGHRIELGEIEKVLMKHSGLSEVVVTVAQNVQQEKALLATVVAKQCGRTEDIQNEKTVVEKTFESKSFNSPSVEDVKALVGLRDEISGLSMLKTLIELGCFDLDGGNFGPLISKKEMEDILHQSIEKRHIWIVKRWIRFLVDDGYLQKGPDGRLQIKSDLSEPCEAENRPVCQATLFNQKIERLWLAFEEKWKAVESRDTGAYLTYLKVNIRHLTDLVKGECDPVQLLYPEGRNDVLDALYKKTVAASAINGKMSEVVHAIAKTRGNKPIRILEIGAGSGASTETIMAKLENKFDILYHFTDVSSQFVAKARSRYKDCGWMRFNRFDIDEDFRSQGYLPNEFDMIIAPGVLENAKNMKETLKNLKEMARPGGWIIYSQPVHDEPWILVSQAFMMTPPQDTLRKQNIYLKEHQWKDVFESIDRYGEIFMYPKADDAVSGYRMKLFAKQFDKGRKAVETSELRELAQAHLPRYMVPQQIQVIDDMPLTRNGKVDRPKLASWFVQENKGESKFETETGGEFKENESLQGVDQNLFDLVANTLKNAFGITKIDLDISFYEYGADSLVMAQVAGKLKDLVNTTYAPAQLAFDSILRQLMNAPNLRALIEFVQKNAFSENLAVEEMGKSENEKATNAVLSFHGPKDAAVYRIVFHAGVGTMKGFYHFIEALKAQNSGTILSIGIDDVDTYCSYSPETVIEELADDYADQICQMGCRQVQLIGYSLGGLVAVEASRRLVERGLDVIDLSLIDSYHVPFCVEDEIVIETMYLPNFKITMGDVLSGVSNRDIEDTLMRCFENNNNTFPQNALVDHWESATDSLENEWIGKLSGLSQRERIDLYSKSLTLKYNDAQTPEVFKQYYRAYRQSFKAANFTPDPYFGDIRYFKAKERMTFLLANEKDTIDFWKDICIGALDVTEIEGDHITCIDHFKNAKSLAGQMQIPAGALQAI